MTDDPAVIQGRLRNLITNFRRLGLLPALQEMTFDEVVNLWWQAQNLKADQQDWEAKRAADPDNMAHKSPEYVAEWHAKRRSLHPE